MTTALLVPPASEPLSLAEVKTHLRVDHDHEDALIGQILTAARQYAELRSGQQLITQSWRQYESVFPGDGCVTLKITPVQSIAAVTAFDVDGTPSVIAPQDTELVRGASPAVLRFDPAFDRSRAANGLEIDLVAGFGDLGVDVLEALKRAILLLVAHWYEFRGAVAPKDQPVSLPPGFDALVEPFRRAHL